MKATTAHFLSLTLTLSLTNASLSGCSSTTTKSTVTRQETAPAAASDGSAAADKGSTVVTEKTETVTESNSGAGCSGVLSCTFAGVGWVIALPFRIIAGAVELVF